LIEELAEFVRLE
jgi:hypothetical protein